MKKYLLLMLLSVWAVLPTLADAGPKPHMCFHIRYEGDRASRFLRLVQLQYKTPKDSVPTDSLHNETHRGPETLTCDSPQECRSGAYGYQPYQRLMFVFTDDTLYSGFFERAAFGSTYEVTVTDTEIRIDDTTPWIARDVEPYSFIRALLVTVSVELLGLLLVLLIFKYPNKGRFLLAVLLANLVSLPIFWFGIMALLNSTAGWFIGELFVLLFESVFVWYFMKKPSSLGRMALLVLFLNFLSMLAGGAALFFIVLFS